MQTNVPVSPARRDHSAALPIAHGVLRVLIVLNWIYGAAILAILLGSFGSHGWLDRTFPMTSAAATNRILAGLRAIAVLGLVTVPLHYGVLRRLLAIVESVREDDPFVSANAGRLEAIARCLLALQLLSLIIGGIGSAVSTAAQVPLDLDAGFSTAGWLAVVLAFVLARVFAAGARMREDLAGTV